MAVDDVRGLIFINYLLNIYFCQKKKHVLSLLIFCLIFCIIMTIKWSSQMDIHLITSSRQENIPDDSCFDCVKDTTFYISMYNSVTNNSSKVCFTLLFKENSSAAVKRFKKYNVTRPLDTDNGIKTNDENLVGQNNNETPGVQTRDEKLVRQIKTCNQYVILGGTMGRIGNQMFEVAAVIGMAIKHDMIPIIEKNILLSKYFNIPNQVDKVCLDMLNVRKCICNKASFHYNCTDEFHSGANVSMHGYLQSWKYFVHAEFVIRSIFKLKDAYLFKAKEYIESIYLKASQLVCLHIRRGDMTTHALYEFGYVLPNMTFIEKAKRFYTNKYDKVQFLVVSEDKRWCKENLKDLYISPFTDAGVDLALLTLCHHVIVTGGSYGWWGAWLAGGSVVFFNGHQRPNSTLNLETNNADYYPPSWIGMSQNP